MILTHLQNQLQALSLILYTSQLKLRDYVGITISMYSRTVHHFQMLYGFSPSTKSKKCKEASLAKPSFIFLPTKGHVNLREFL